MPVTLQQDKCPAIRFGKVAVENRNKTIELGRLYTEDRDVVYVKQIGEKDEIERDAKEWLAQLRDRAYGSNGNPPSIPVDWYERAVKLYENFQRGFADQPDGFPVREWAILTPAQVANLHAMQTFTIEQVAGWNENAIAMYGIGGRELRDKAKLWLASGDVKAEQISALQVENESLKARLDKITRELEDLKASSSDDRPQRGRPRKEVEPA